MNLRMNLNQRAERLDRIQARLAEHESEAKKFQETASIIAKGAKAISEGKDKWEHYQIKELKAKLDAIQKHHGPLPNLAELDEWNKQLDAAYAYLQAKYHDNPSLKNESKYQKRETEIADLRTAIEQIRNQITTSLPQPVLSQSQSSITSHVETVSESKSASGNANVAWGDKFVYQEDEMDALLGAAVQDQRDIRRIAGLGSLVEFREPLLSQEKAKAAEVKATEKIKAKIEKTIKESEDIEETSARADLLAANAIKFQKQQPNKTPSFWAKCLPCCCGEKEESVDKTGYVPIRQEM